MSDDPRSSHEQRAVHASSSSSAPAPRPHRGSVSRPQMHPTRLFTSQINSIIKDKDRRRPKNSCRVSPESLSPIKRGADTPPMEPDRTPPARPIFEHLSDREGPSGAEDNEDLEKSSLKCETLSETILVKVETTTITEDPEEMSMAHSSSGLDSACEEVTSTAQQPLVSLSPISSADLLASPASNSCAGVDREECTSWLKETEVSDSDEKELTLHGTSSVCSGSKRKKSERSVKSSSRKRGEKSRLSDFHRTKRQQSPVASQSQPKLSSNTEDVTRHRKMKDSERRSLKEEEVSDDALAQGQYRSVTKTFSSGRSDDTEGSQSEKEFGCKLLTISKDNSSSLSQPALKSQNSDGIVKSSSSAADFIPLELPSNRHSLKPDTPYKIPTISQSPMHFESPPSTPGYHSPRPLFFYESWMSTPPPPPPTMVQGRFQWNTTATPPIVAPPLSLSNQLVSQPLPLSMFAPSQEDKRYQCLQTLHTPPKPSMFGYQLIGDSMLLRFSNKILNESITFKEGLRFLGFCVSGQKIGDLLKRLRTGFYHLGKKVILMIGTNDLFQNTKIDQMCHELRRVVDHLRNEVDELVILTIPPVPLIEATNHHWNRLNEYNRYIKQLPQKYNDARISVSDISPLYLLSQEEIEEEEMLAIVNAEIPYCRGCLTCLEESEDVNWDCSAMSDEEDVTDLSVVARVLIGTNPTIKPLDTCGIFFDKKVQKCRRDYFELTYSDSSRKDLIHLNLKGLTVIKDQLVKIL